MAGKISYAAIASKNIKNQESSKPNVENSAGLKVVQAPLEEFPSLKDSNESEANEEVVVKSVPVAEVQVVVEKQQIIEVKEETPIKTQTPAPVQIAEEEEVGGSDFIEKKKRIPRNKTSSSRPSSYRSTNYGSRENGPRRNNNNAKKNNSDTASINGQSAKRANDTRTFDERFEEEKAKYLNRFKEPKSAFCFDFIRGDLFSLGEKTSLAHCVSEDFAMSRGIATEFKKRFSGVDELLSQNVKVGGCAYLKNEERYIFYLVTKKFASYKPYYNSVEKSLKALRDLCKELNVSDLAMPMIGCGLDRLEWNVVSRIIDDVFGKSGLKITVSRFEKMDNRESNTSRN